MPPMNSNTPYDLAIIGGGLSGSVLLIKLLERLSVERLAGHAPPRRIMVLDRYGAFGAGVPYGDQHTEPGFLLIETVSKSTPVEFQDWLVCHRADLLADLAQQTDRAVQAWLLANGAAFAEGRIAELFVPRRLFGRFISLRLQDQVSAARMAGLAAVDLVRAEVSDLRAEPRGTFALTTGTGRLRADTVVVAVGSIPRQHCSEVGLADGYVHDLWDEGYAAVTQAILGRSGELVRPVDVAIVGSGASAGEVLYFLAHSPELLRRLHSIKVVSRSGYIAGGGAGYARNADGPPPEFATARPAAREYTLAVRQLADAGLLSALAAAVEPVPRRAANGRLELSHTRGPEGILLADVVINCTGSGQLKSTRSSLLSSMCQPVRGFRINRLGIGFELQPPGVETARVDGCFIIGPLQNEEDIATHVESIHGVYRAASSLVEQLCRRLDGSCDRLRPAVSASP